MSIDYPLLGLKIGIEIHQQLATSTKLFCGCKAELSTNPPEFTFYRRLRPTQSELGAVDPAAAFEFQRGRGFQYEVDNETSCLVEMDEEPPHALNEEAVDICLEASMMLDAKPVDEIHVMRKIVIDGSNTTGFQRTCIIALGGKVRVGEKSVGLQTISLEEDAARKTGEKGSITTYRLDRLSIPLIEIATAPEIYTPEDAEKVAFALGRVLRATRRVRRGLGTIRQDLNISIVGGALTEVKGVQELGLVAPMVEMEVQRQIGLLKIASELKEKRIDERELGEEFIDVSEAFKTTNCKVIRTAFEKGGTVYALRLSGFSGLLGRELAPGLRLGTEFSDYAKFWGRVGGLFHTDELPAYGITEEEVRKIRELTKAKDGDAVIIVADEKQAVLDALRAVLDRAKVAINGVPSETRAAQLDGSTRFSRPRPGAARMYPETDVPPVVVDQGKLQRIRDELPTQPDVKLKQLMNDYGINEKLASQILSSEYVELFERTATETTIAPSFVAATLVETIKGLSRQDIHISNLSEKTLFEVLKLVNSGRAAKEAIPDILSWLTKNSSRLPDEAVKALGFETVSQEKLEAVVSKVVKENKRLIDKRGDGALGPLMGTLMKELRGKVDAKTLSEILRKKIESVSTNNEST